MYCSPRLGRWLGPLPCLLNAAGTHPLKGRTGSGTTTSEHLPILGNTCARSTKPASANPQIHSRGNQSGWIAHGGIPALKSGEEVKGAKRPGGVTADLSARIRRIFCSPDSHEGCPVSFRRTGPTGFEEIYPDPNHFYRLNGITPYRSCRSSLCSCVTWTPSDVRPRGSTRRSQ